MMRRAEVRHQGTLPESTGRARRYVEARRRPVRLGGHFHQSLLSSETGENVFHDPGSENGLSAVARSFIAGQLATQAEFGCIWAPTPNAYKRILPFVGGTVGWAFENRAAALRVTGKDAGTSASTSGCRAANERLSGDGGRARRRASRDRSGPRALRRRVGDFFEKPGDETIPTTSRQRSSGSRRANRARVSRRGVRAALRRLAPVGGPAGARVRDRARSWRAMRTLSRGASR